MYPNQTLISMINKQAMVIAREIVDQDDVAERPADTLTMKNQCMSGISFIKLIWFP
jgi:hypothetical protein